MKLKPVEFVGPKDSNNKEKSPVKQWLDRFVDFKNSPTLQAIEKTTYQTSCNLKEFLYASSSTILPETQLSDQELQEKAMDLQESGATKAYVKYAERKFLLRNEIASLGAEQIQNPGVTFSYLYTKYERYLVNSQLTNDTGKRNPKLELILFQLYEQSKLQEKIKDKHLADFLIAYFPDVTIPPALGSTTLEILPQAVHLKTTDKEFLQRLYHNKDEAVSDHDSCGGFFTTIKDLYVITELVYEEQNAAEQTDTRTHELFHTEVKLNGLQRHNYEHNLTDKYNIKKKVIQSSIEEEVRAVFKKYFKLIEKRFSEEVFAYFSEPNHPFDDEIFDYYLQNYTIDNDTIMRSLSKNKHLNWSTQAKLYYEFIDPNNIQNIKQRIFSQKEALDIMHKKGYPKQWILNSLSSLDETPATLEGVNLKALAISLPEYDPDLGLRQKSVIDKLYAKNQMKAADLREQIVLEPELTEKLEMYVTRPGFEGNGVTGSHFFDMTIRTLLLSDNLKLKLKDMVFGEDIIKILDQHGESQIVRQVIADKLTSLKQAGIAKIMAQKKTE